MKLLAIVAVCLVGGLATADGANDAEIIDELEVRLSEIEVIDVTAEKSPGEDSGDIDADIEAILDEAEALESVDTTE